jgi:NADH:ubiquinone oxidoreductase subunit C
LKYLKRNDKNLNLYITENDLYYASLHIKLSSLFYSTQLIDIFAYEIPNVNNIKNNSTKKIPLINNSLLVYNFHSINFHQRFFLFVYLNSTYNLKNLTNYWGNVNSITELFPNANWLERENSELHGIFFYGKKDLRNLMLVYGDTSAPLRKSFPSIGTREIYYDAPSDLLVQSPVTIQF